MPPDGGGWEVALVPGQRIGRFRLIRELGRGGFGVVFEAEDSELKRKVALKAVRTGHRDELRRERLLEEAEAAARLAHPNIVTLFDLGRSEHGPYLVLELLEGETLQARVERGVVPPVEAVRIATGIARGLSHAHARGVVHRDLKPGNVFLTSDGGVKVLDFGLAHAFGLKRTEGGTPAYMAPEQWTGAPEDERTDVFALGVVLYRMLSGRLPFRPENPGEVTGPSPAPDLEVAGLPALGELVATMLEKDPVHRPRDGGVVLRALELVGQVLRGAGESAPGPEAVVVRRREPAPWWRTRVAGIAAIAAVVIAAAALGVAVRMARKATIAPAADERIVLAVADVENGTGDRELDGLSGMLATSLEQSRKIDVLPRVRLIDLFGRDAFQKGEPLDADRATAAAERVRARAVVVPILRRLGALYVAEVRVTDPSSGARLLSLREQETEKERLPDLVDRVSERVRLGLGEAPEAIRETSIALARSVTRSLEAWSHFARGQACVEQSGFFVGYGPCLEEFKRATAIDPEFGLAHLLTSEVSYSLGLSRAEQRSALEPALRLLDRIPPSHQQRVKGWAAFLDGKDVEAKRLLKEAAIRAGDDKFAWRRAGEVPFHRDEFAEAAPIFERVSELDPAWPEGVEHLAIALGALDDRDGLAALETRVAALPESPATRAGLCFIRLWAGAPSTLATCEKASAGGADAAGTQFFAMALLHAGERDRLHRLVTQMSEGQSLNSFGPFMRVLLQVQEGRWEELAKTGETIHGFKDAWLQAGWFEAVAGSGDADVAHREALLALELDPALVTHVAPHLAYLGDLRRAAEFAAYLPVDSPRAATYRAIVHWRQGDRVKAIEELHAVVRHTPFSVDPAMPHPAFVLGEMLVEQGRNAEAVEVLTRFLGFPLNYPSWEYPRALLALAKAQAREGMPKRARRNIGLLLGMWGEAASSQPGLEEARKTSLELGRE
ncbi:MAG: protein kinase [Anaeromyxobacteraceae bacterium]